ncbi:MAG: pseudaminic acid synthase [Magnetovibrio sp.]|nr:pseudaminic acid synthase [Magnetovibrio sp.]
MNAKTIPLLIEGRRICEDTPPYVIAELSGNHNGDINRAYSIMEAAKHAGADAVKLQTYTADTLTIDHDGPGFSIHDGPWAGRNLYDLYQEASTPWEWHEKLFQKGRDLEITVFSSPFDETAVDLLEELGCPAYKIASFEAVDFPLLEKVASTRKPVIVSTGMVDQTEIGELIACLREAASGEIALLHCVSEYPALPESSNLRSIQALSNRYGVVVGLSDHTLGTVTSVSAVALGASIIEKHVTLSRSDGGVDAAFSLEPHELKMLVADCNTAWSAKGEIVIGRQEAAEGNKKYRRSLYAVMDIKKGETLSSDNIRSIRPGYGLEPKSYKDVLGHKAKFDIARGTPLDWRMFR